MKRLLIAAGGTGGHIYPAMVVAKLAAQQGYEILWLGTRGRMEEKLVPGHYPIEYINMRALRGKGLYAKLLMPWRLLRAIIQSQRIIKRFKPDCLLTMGGFVCAPAGLAAKLTRIPLVVHEQNAVAGLTNKLLARFATSLLEAFPNAFAPGVTVKTVGNPARQDLFQLSPTHERLASRQGKPRLLVLGGSQGAHFINRTVLAAIERMPEAHRPSVWHQTGEQDEAGVKGKSECLATDYKVQAYIHDMSDAYDWADLVLCRSGALTVSELATVGLASILVPFPKAVDDHQRLNADFLAKRQAAWLMDQRDMTEQSLCQQLMRAFSDRGELVAMGERAQIASQSKAAMQVLYECEYVGQKKN